MDLTVNLTFDPDADLARWTFRGDCVTKGEDGISDQITIPEDGAGTITFELHSDKTLAVFQALPVMWAHARPELLVWNTESPSPDFTAARLGLQKATITYCGSGKGVVARFKVCTSYDHGGSVVAEDSRDPSIVRENPWAGA